MRHHAHERERGARENKGEGGGQKGNWHTRTHAPVTEKGFSFQNDQNFTLSHTHRQARRHEHTHTHTHTRYRERIRVSKSHRPHSLTRMQAEKGFPFENPQNFTPSHTYKQTCRHEHTHTHTHLIKRKDSHFTIPKTPYECSICPYCFWNSKFLINAWTAAVYNFWSTFREQQSMFWNVL